MGKIAEPSIPYCTTTPGAALSVNGAIYSTENPPIQYVRSGNSVIISDVLGEIATADISDFPLTLLGEGVATEGAEYCGSAQRSSLEWDTNIVVTDYPPISYTIEDNTEQIKVDWGGGDVDYLTGTSWTVTTSTAPTLVAQLLFNNQICFPTPVPVIIDANLWSASGISDNVGPQVIPANYRVTLDLGFGNTVATANAGQRLTITQFHCLGSFYGRGYVNSNPVVRFTGGVVYYLSTVTTVTSNTGQTSTRTGKTPVVSLFDGGYLITITDGNGVLTTQTSATDPGEFRYRCYGYDLSLISYACEGECPGGTAFQCLCPATNQRYCYGFDPDNPDVFKPLFTTTIAP